MRKSSLPPGRLFTDAHMLAVDKRVRMLHYTTRTELDDVDNDTRGAEFANHGLVQKSMGRSGKCGVDEKTRDVGHVFDSGLTGCSDCVNQLGNDIVTCTQHEAGTKKYKIIIIIMRRSHKITPFLVHAHPSSVLCWYF